MKTTEVDLTPMIVSHFTTGMSANEITESANLRKRLNDLFLLYDMYNENPCMDIVKCLRHKFKHRADQIAEDVVYFDYIRNNFQRMTRQKAKDLVNWSAEKVMRDSASVNDRRGMLDAAKVLTRANQLDKPEPEAVEKQIRPQAWVLTTRVEVLDPDRQTIQDPILLGYMKKWGAHIDEHDAAINQKLQQMKEDSIAAKREELKHSLEPKPVTFGHKIEIPCPDQESH